MFKENVSLREHTTFKTGGMARYFFSVKNEEEAREALAFAGRMKLPFFVLGSGSNILFRDGLFDGVIIKNEIKGMSAGRQAGGRPLIESGAGEDWDDLVAFSVLKGFPGMENLSGIPGTVGASAVQNIGAYGREAKDFISAVFAVSAEDLKERVFTKEECAFGYRDSFFKSSAGKKFIITKVEFSFSDDAVAPDISYRDLAEFFAGRSAGSVSGAEVREAVLKIRKEKLPDLARFGTAGSFFKNPVVSRAEGEALKKKFPEIRVFDDGEKSKVSLASVLDKVCNLKGHKKGKVGLYEKQPLVVVNFGGASFEEVSAFAEEIVRTVREKTGLEIEREAEYV